MSPAHRSLRLWFFNVIAPTGSITLLGSYVYTKRDQFESLAEIPLIEVTVAGMLTLIAFYINSLEFALLYRAMGARIGEHWMLYAAGQVGNYAPGQLGTLYRLRYLKEVHHLPYTVSAAAYGANFVITMFATGVVGLAGSVALGIQEGTWSIPLISLLIALLAAACLIAVLPVKAPNRSGRVRSAWMQLGKGWQRAQANRATAIGVLLLEIVRYMLAAWRLDVVFGWLGVDETLSFYLIIAPIASLATFVAFTPAGLGIRELAIGTVVIALGRSFESGLLGSSADRTVNMIVVLLTGVPGIIYTTRVMGRISASRAAPGPSD